MKAVFFDLFAIVKSLFLRLSLIVGLIFTAGFLSSCYSDPHPYYGGYRGGYYGGYYGPPPGAYYSTGYYYRNQYYRFRQPYYGGRYVHQGRYPNSGRGGSSGGGAYHYPREGGGSAGAPRPNPQGRGNATYRSSAGRGGSGQVYSNPRAVPQAPAPQSPRGGNAPQRGGGGGGDGGNRKKR